MKIGIGEIVIVAARKADGTPAGVVLARAHTSSKGERIPFARIFRAPEADNALVLQLVGGARLEAAKAALKVMTEVGFKKAYAAAIAKGLIIKA